MWLRRSKLKARSGAVQEWQMGTFAYARVQISSSSRSQVGRLPKQSDVRYGAGKELPVYGQ